MLSKNYGKKLVIKTDKHHKKALNQTSKMTCRLRGEKYNKNEWTINSNPIGLNLNERFTFVIMITWKHNRVMNIIKNNVKYLESISDNGQPKPTQVIMKMLFSIWFS